MNEPAPDLDPTGAYQPPRSAADSSGERFAPGALLAGRYRVVAQLGKGGMGEVYRADDLTLGQPVALKFLPQHVAQDADRLARFRKEVAAARRVSHPHVCRVYDIGQHDGLSFLTMEFVDGEDLFSVLRRIGRVPEEKGVELARQLCSALAAVHEQGLLHRDLKPANVMLDGRGKARLTDFGLAAAAEDLTASEIHSGTPLYQAPEQLAGREVTVRSDLYALGLVLYELFTGKRAFASSQRSEAPSKPSSHVSGLSPAVETVILKCLATDPANRPRSAAEVLSRLPGGDPLAAAIAAGETPSPGLVAAAPLEGTLRPSIAGAMFAAVVVLLLVIAALNDRFKAHRYLPLPSPAVLDDKARQIVRSLGYTEQPADTFGVFEMPTDHQYYMASHGGQAAVPLADMDDCRPPLLVYWHRQSPEPLIPFIRADQRMAGERLMSRNPPTTVPGMVKLGMDTRGRLVEFLAVPDPKPQPTDTALAMDWDAVLRLAELHGAGVLRPESAERITPPFYADELRAWSGKYPERPDLAIRVEAASYRGRLTWFRITHPAWGDPPTDRPVPISLRGSVFFDVIRLLFGLVILGLFAFAVRNVLRGSADLRGAAVVAGVCFAFQFLFDMLAGVHFPAWNLVVPLLVSELAFLIFFALLGIASYLALEPFIRRRSPHRLTAWTRLAGGRWLDPLVGRHVLIGIAAGAVCSLDWPALPFWSSNVGPTVVRNFSFMHPVGNLFGTASVTVGITWLFAGVLTIVQSLTRREWAGIAVVMALFGLSTLASGMPGLHQFFQLVRVAVGIALFLRLGILAAIACHFTMDLISATPLSLDASTWYFSASLTSFAALIGLAAYGAWISLGNQKSLSAAFGDD